MAMQWKIMTMVMAAAVIMLSAGVQARNVLPIRQGPGYVIWCTGACTRNVTTRPYGGLMLMGGGTDVDLAFRWFNQQTDGGDVVVLRASGTDAYNEYIYDLGIVNSVWTILTTSKQGADAKDVEDVIYSAEGIFVAGGDQSAYVDYWQGSYLQRAVQYQIDNNNVVFGGTSAGLAVAGEYVYTGENGSIISEEALADPYDSMMTITGPLFYLPYMESIITDSHFYERDRMGRILTMMARLEEDGDVSRAYGIAVSEQTALVIDSDGYGKLFGRNEAYVLDGAGVAGRCEPGSPLTYVDTRIYKLDSTSSTFDFVDWSGSGGVQYYIDVVSGRLISSNGRVYG